LGLVDDSEAVNFRGYMFGCNQAALDCNLSSTPPSFVSFNPSFACDAVEIEYEAPISEGVYVQYWNDCVSTVNPLPVLTAANQGFINQLFCDFDVNGYPMAPASIGTPLAGQVSQLPSIGALTDDLAAEIDPATTCVSNEAGMELIQSDFWILIPDYVTDVGLRLGGGGADASLLLIGSDCTDMIATAELLDGAGAGLEGVAETYYTIPDTVSSDCGGTYLRARLYTTDIAAGFATNPEINIGTGFDKVDNIDDVIVIPATGPNDCVAPAPMTQTLTGYLDINNNIFAADATTYVPFACGFTLLANTNGDDITDAACVNGGDLEFDLNLTSNISTSYTLSGASPTSGSYNSATTFTIVGGATGQDFTVTVTDDLTGCEIDITIIGAECGCDDFIMNGVGLCAYIAANPTSALATADCDLGGVDKNDRSNNRLINTRHWLYPTRSY